jgi:hypothetical protein
VAGAHFQRNENAKTFGLAFLERTDLPLVYVSDCADFVFYYMAVCSRPCKRRGVNHGGDSDWVYFVAWRNGKNKRLALYCRRFNPRGIA